MAKPLDIDDLLQHVLNFLSLQDRLTCSLVSKRWCKLLRKTPIFDAITVRTSTSQESIQRGGQVWGAAVRFIKLDGDHLSIDEKEPNHAHLPMFLSLFPHLEFLAVFAPTKPETKGTWSEKRGLDLSRLGVTSHLNKLYVGSYYRDIIGASSLVLLKQFHTFQFMAQMSIGEIHALAHCTTLRKLHVLDGFCNTKNTPNCLQPLTTLTCLTSLTSPSRQLPNDMSMWPLDELKVWLDFWKPGIKMLKTAAAHLKVLDIQGSLEDDAVAGISACTNLTWLKMQGLPDTVRSLDFLSACTKLKHLDVGFSYDITDISALGCFTQLTFLAMNLARLKDISPVSTCTHLRTLHLYYSKLEDITHVSFCTNLVFIRLVHLHCDGLDLSCLCKARKLRNVELRACTDLDTDGVAAVRKHVLANGGTFLESTKEF